MGPHSPEKPNVKKKKASLDETKAQFPASSSGGKHRSLTLVMSFLNLFGESDKSNLLLTDQAETVFKMHYFSSFWIAVWLLGGRLGVQLNTACNFIYVL